MKKLSFLLALIILSLATTGYAQKKESNKKKTPSISLEERQQSATFADGLREYYANDYQNAEKTLRSVINANPKNDAAYFVLGKVCYDAQRYGEALDYFLRASEIDKENIWYTVELAKTYKQVGDLEKAAESWEDVCKAKNNNEYFLYELAECYLLLEQYTKVIDVYNRMEHLMGSNDMLTQVKVNIWLHINDVKNAAGEYDKLINLYPNDVTYYILAGNIYRSNNMPETALEYYKRAEKINANHPSLCVALYEFYTTYRNEANIKTENPDEYIHTVIENNEVPFEDKYKFIRKYVDQAFRSKKKDDVALAQNLTDKMKALYPDAITLYNEISILQIMNNNLPEAKKSLEIIIDNGNVSLTTWSNYVKVLNDLKDFNSLYKKSETIAELFPTNAILLFEIGKACNLAKDFKKAIEYLEQASTYAYENNLVGHIQLELGNAYSGLGETEKAEKYWSNAEKKGVKK